MNLRVFLTTSAFVLLAMVGVSATGEDGDRGPGDHDAHRAQVWFAPNDDLPRGPNRDRYLNHDFPHLFDPKPAWDAKIDAFKISPLMGSAVGPADELVRINAFLKDHRIALSVDTGGVTLDNPLPTPGECGYGVEGMARPGRNAINFRRLKSLGIEVAYVTLDEPLTYGHYYNRKGACRYSIDDVAQRVANEITQIRQYYPNVPVVDVEAPQMTTTAQWNADFPRWLKAFHDASGTPFDAVVYDMVMSQPWQAVAAPGIRMAHAVGVRAGIILDGAGPGGPDAVAVAGYKQNMQAVEASGLKFDIYMVANWTPYPSRNLPQSDPDTLTSVLAWYLRQHREDGGPSR